MDPLMTALRSTPRLPSGVTRQRLEWKPHVLSTWPLFASG
jgi:hypothetical protein